MGEIPHDVPDCGGTVPKKMQNPSTTSEVMLMMTMREGNTEEMIVTDASSMIKIGAMTMTVAMTTTGEINHLIEDPLIRMLRSLISAKKIRINGSMRLSITFPSTRCHRMRGFTW